MDITEKTDNVILICKNFDRRVLRVSQEILRGTFNELVVQKKKKLKKITIYYDNIVI